MSAIVDSEGTEFDPFEHMLTDNPIGPYLTSKGKFRKLRAGTSNDGELVAKWLEKPQVVEQAEDDVPALLPAVKKTSGPDLQLVAKELNAQFLPHETGGTFVKETYRVSINAANYTDNNQVRMALRKWGLTG